MKNEQDPQPDNSLASLEEGLSSVVNGLPINPAIESAAAIGRSAAGINGLAGDTSALLDVEAMLNLAGEKLYKAIENLQGANAEICQYAGGLGLSVGDEKGSSLSGGDISPSRWRQQHQERELTIFQLQGERDAVPSPVFKGDRARIHDHLLRAREDILERFPPEIEGLDIERARAFLDLKFNKLRQPALVVVDSSKREQLLRAIYTDHNLEVRMSSSTEDFYLPSVDIAFVLRDRGMEELNGPDYTESLIAKQLWRGTCEPGDITLFRKYRGWEDIYVPKTGFAEKAGPLGRYTGVFWEIGCAEYVRHLYIRDVLGRPQGFAEPQPGDRNLWRSVFRDIVPNTFQRYRSPRAPRDRVIDFNDEDYAGAAVKLLVERDPNLASVMAWARTDPRGVDEFRDRVNAIKPGLFDELSQSSNSGSDFKTALLKVARALGRIRQ